MKQKYRAQTWWLYTLFHLSSVNVTLPSEPGVGTMPVHHLRMLGRHRASYNKQDIVLARLLYHLNTAHINASVSRVGTTLVHPLQMLAQLRTNIVRKTTLPARVGVDYNHNRRLRFLIDYIVIIIKIVIMFFEIL